MKILCLNPPFKTEFGRFSRTSRSPAITKSGTIYYPIWLCYVAGALEKAGHEVVVIDSCAYGYDLNQTLKIAAECKPSLAVLDTSTPSIHDDTFMDEPYNGPLIKYPQVVLTPHGGSYTFECRSTMEMEAVDNLLSALNEIG